MATSGSRASTRLPNLDLWLARIDAFAKSQPVARARHAGPVGIGASRPFGGARTPRVAWTVAHGSGYGLAKGERDSTGLVRRSCRVAPFRVGSSPLRMMFRGRIEPAPDDVPRSYGGRSRRWSEHGDGVTTRRGRPVAGLGPAQHGAPDLAGRRRHRRSFRFGSRSRPFWTSPWSDRARSGRNSSGSGPKGAGPNRRRASGRTRRSRSI
jgi:hypothetical protein